MKSMNFKQGDSFKATMQGTSTEGKISFCKFENTDYVVLCQNDVIGGNDNFHKLKFERYGYNFIYVLDKYNMEILEQNKHLSVRNFELISNRKKRIENLNI